MAPLYHAPEPAIQHAAVIGLAGHSADFCRFCLVRVAEMAQSEAGRHVEVEGGGVLRRGRACLLRCLVGRQRTTLWTSTLVVVGG